VEILEELQYRSPAATLQQRITARRLLVRGGKEQSGYALYSYLLLTPAVKGSVAEERNRKALESFLQLVMPFAELERKFPRSILNVLYVPVVKANVPPKTEPLLQNYDFAGAEAVLQQLPQRPRNGPVIVATSSPFSRGNLRMPALVQDLSWVSPKVVQYWLEEYMNQTAQENFAETKITPPLALRLRTIISILGTVAPDARASLMSWIRIADK
jgi:hypothetical protein